MTREIKLLHGQVAIVDEQYYEKVAGLQWYLHRKATGRELFTIRAKGGNLILHRVLLDAPKGSMIQHIDGNPLNNTRSNLRYVNQQQAHARQGKCRQPKTSRFKGVSWSKRKNCWRSYGKVNGKFVHLGLHKTETEAADRYNEWAVDAFGQDHATLNDLLQEKRKKFNDGMDDIQQKVEDLRHGM